MTTQSRGTALITGASSGIGEVYAERLADRGYDLILAARRVDRLTALAKKISTKTGRKVDVVQTDLSVRADVAKLEQRLKSDKQITLLVNNAGISMQGGIFDNEAPEIEKLIAVNITAPTLLAAAAAKAFKAADKGGIINIASVLAYAPEMFDGVYSGSKAHLLNVTLGLAELLKDTKVQVQAVLPGATKTEIWDKMGDPEAMMPGMVMSASDLVDAALVGFDRKETITIPPLQDDKLHKTMEAARTAMGPHLSMKEPAPRYRKAA